MYLIKPHTIVETPKIFSVGKTGICHTVLKGWRKFDYYEDRPPFIYLGYKYEDWTYNYQHTSKIHYVLWKGELYVMDNQFAKHIVPLGDFDG